MMLFGEIEQQPLRVADECRLVGGRVHEPQFNDISLRGNDISLNNE